MRAKYKKLDKIKKVSITNILNKGFEFLEEYNNNRDDYLKQIINLFDTDRATAKELFSSIFNGGSLDSWKKKNKISNFNETNDITDFINKLYNEHQIIEDVITRYNPKLKKMLLEMKEDKNNQTYNIDHSTTAIYLYEIENRILESVFNYLTDRNIITSEEVNGDIVYNCILEFDGLKIYKSEITEVLIDSINKHVLETFNINIEFTIKGIDEFYTMDEMEGIKNNKLKSYEDIKEEFEVNNFKVRNPIMFCEIKNDKLMKRDKSDFKTVYENLNYQELDKNGEIKKISFIDRWLKDDDIRTYENFDFLPCEEVPRDIYNSFNGYNGEKFELIKEDIEKSLMWQHIKNVVCKNNNSFEYLSKWIANIIQHPLRKTNTALVLQGNQGVGKDTFIHILQKIIGNEYTFKADKPDLVFGKFNGSIENVVLCVLNEASGKDNYQINESIKDAITRNTTNIHNKGLKPYTVNDGASYIFMSNNDNPLQIPADDRRFFCIAIPDDYMNNKEYFAPIYEELKQGDYIKAIYNYFKNLDITDYDFINNRPQSENYEYMRAMNTPILALFLEDYINSAEDPDNLISKSSTNMYNRYNEFITDGKFPHSMHIRKFSLDIMKYEGITKVKTRINNIFEFDTVKLKQHLTKKYKIEFNNNDDLL